MRTRVILIALALSGAAFGQSALPPAPYANTQLDDPAKEASAKALFDVVGKGIVQVQINQRYALKDAAKAQADLEARKTTGCTLLTL